MFEIMEAFEGSHAPRVALGSTSRHGMLSLSVEAAELLEVNAKPRVEPPGTFKLDPAIPNLYKVTSMKPTYLSWVALDGRRGEHCYYSKLLCISVCKYTFEERFYDEDLERDIKLREHAHYFLLLEETDSASSSYRRVGVGASTWDHWFKRNSEKRIVNIE
jgi:hypothetical protein